MKYLTGDKISTSTAAWTTARGAKCELTLVRNAKLGVNGWLESGSHTLNLSINGNPESFCGLVENASGTLAVQARMGRASAQVAAEQATIVRALVAEYRDHNDATLRAEMAAEDQYQDEHAAIERMRTAA